MRPLICIGAASILTFACLSAAFAAELRTGESYPPGSRIESLADGVSFALPAEWTGGVPAGSAWFVAGSDTQPGVGLVVMQPSATWEDAASLMQEPLDLGDGVVLTADSAGRRTQQGLEQEYRGGPYAGYAVANLGQPGNGILVMFAGPSEKLDYYRELALEMVASADFTSPASTPAQQQWVQVLSGNMLKRMSSYYSDGIDGSYVGDSSSETLHLCRDGSYAYHARSSFAADSGGGVSGYSGGGDADHGQWSVEVMGDRVLLALRSAEGGSSHHAINLGDGQTFLDGDRVYRVPSDRCP
jgi:hypothetical protein